MHNIDIRCNIRNPNIETVISVPQVDDLNEAIYLFGKDHCLQILNLHAIKTARTDWNTRIVTELYNKSRK